MDSEYIISKIVLKNNIIAGLQFTLIKKHVFLATCCIKKH